MTGPTTTGSIDAKLTIDKSAWDRNKDEAKAEAAELGALNPEIKVDANVGPALAKLEAVAKAERNLESAYMRSAIAQQKLDVATEKHGEDSLQAAQARLTLKRATDAETDAEAKLAASKARTTAEQDKETESTERAINTRRRHVSGMQVLLALTPAIVSAAAPVAGAAVGLGAAFGIMAVSGVIAIKGINDEMKKGSDTGNQYAAGLGSLKTNLDSLAGTAANRMLGAFSTTVGDINNRMPGFTVAVGDGSAALGNMGGTVLRNVVDGLGAMNPLLKAGAVELSGFVGWLTNFSQAEGFQDFVAYSVTNLPNVMGMLEKLVTLGGNILAAFAPLGPVVLGFISGLADGLNNVPLPVLAGIVTTSVLIGPALSTAFSPGVAALIVSVAQAIGLTGVMANLAVPVVGVLTAVIAGVGMAAATSALGTDQGTASLISYGDAVERDNGLIGENVRLQAAHAATTKEMRDAAEALGVSTQTVVAAMLGNKDALDQVNAAQDNSIERVNAMKRGDEDFAGAAWRRKTAFETLTNGITTNSAAIDNNIDAYHAYKSITESTTGAMTEQARVQQLNANQFGSSVAMYQAAESAQDKAREATEKQTAAMQLQNDAAGLLKMTLDGLNGDALSAAQAQNAFDSSLANMGTHVSKTGKQITFTTTSINDMSAASVALRGQLNGQISNLQNVIAANGGLENSTGKAREQMKTMRQQIIDNAVAHGVDRDAVTAYVDKILKIPKSVPPTKLDIDKTEAELKLKGFQSAINALTGKTVHIYSVEHMQKVRESGDTGTANSMNTANQYAQGNAYRRAGGGSIYRSGGGPVNYLAGGGAPFPGEPQGTDIVPAWLTPGEEVIKRSSADSLRRNSPGALEYMNSTGRLPQAQAAGMSLTLNVNVNGVTAPREVADIVISEVKWKLQEQGVRLG